MDTEKLNSWLGILANLGVLVGIVFLVIEVRHASDTAQAQMADSAVAGHNALNLAAFSNPQTARTVVVGFHEPDRLSNAEAAQFQFWLRAEINQQLRLWRMHELGFKSAEERQIELKQLGNMLSTPGGELFLEDNRAGFPDQLLLELEPYWAEDPDLGFRLGRDNLPIE